MNEQCFKRRTFAILIFLGSFLLITEFGFCAEKTVDCFMQDVCAGDALKHIDRETVRALRIVAVDPLEGRKEKTPISLGGTDRPLRVLGEVPVEKDGSAWFEVPSDTPIFFQLLDQKGWAIQTMRKPITLTQSTSCLGCHSADGCRLDEPRKADRLALQNNKTARKPKPLIDPKIPFSYSKLVQPIWDRHCISCHTGDYVQDGPAEPLISFLAAPLRHRPSKRMFTESYLTLVDRPEMPLVDWLVPDSKPAVPRPYSFGSIRSELLIHLIPEHYEVDVSDQEKRIIECWIDLGIPF